MKRTEHHEIDLDSDDVRNAVWAWLKDRCSDLPSRAEDIQFDGSSMTVKWVTVSDE